MAGFDDLIGQPSHLREEMQHGRAVHAYLFTGPAGTGKRTLAALCAQTLNCTAPEGQRPCGKCPSCLQYETGNHPDAIRIAPEKSIGVDVVRDLISRMGVHTLESARRTVIIEQADKMTPQAQNALLKTLETPPSDAVLFLVTDQMSALLPTIISRCRVEKFHLLTAEQAQQALEKRGIPPERAALRARLCNGSVGKALEKHASEDFWKNRDKVRRALSLLHTEADVGLAAAPLTESREQAQEILDLIELWARDAMVLAAGGEIMQEDCREEYLNAPFSAEKLLSGVLETRKRLFSNVSWQQALEMLFFEIVSGGK